MNTITITTEDFEELRESGKARAEQAYTVVKLAWHGGAESGQFAWSPDGVGFSSTTPTKNCWQTTDRRTELMKRSELELGKTYRWQSPAPIDCTTTQWSELRTCTEPRPPGGVATIDAPRRCRRS